MSEPTTADPAVAPTDPAPVSYPPAVDDGTTGHPGAWPEPQTAGGFPAPVTDVSPDPALIPPASNPPVPENASPVLERVTDRDKTLPDAATGTYVERAYRIHRRDFDLDVLRDQFKKDAPTDLAFGAIRVDVEDTFTDDMDASRANPTSVDPTDRTEYIAIVTGTGTPTA